MPANSLPFFVVDILLFFEIDHNHLLGQPLIYYDWPLTSSWQEEEPEEGKLEEEDLYTKAEKEFYSIIEQEKKLLEKKQQQGVDTDKADTGKVGFLVGLCMNIGGSIDLMLKRI